MNLLKEFCNKKYLIEEDLSALPEKTIKDLQRLIKKGVENSDQWSNALELVHKAYEVSSIERPNPDMLDAWKQYETLISYAVQQLAKYHGINGNWRMTSESFLEDKKYKIEILINNTIFDSDIIQANSINEAIDMIQDNFEHKTVIEECLESSAILSILQYDCIKTNSQIKLSEI